MSCWSVHSDNNDDNDDDGGDDDSDDDDIGDADHGNDDDDGDDVKRLSPNKCSSVRVGLECSSLTQRSTQLKPDSALQYKYCETCICLDFSMDLSVDI